MSAYNAKPDEIVINRVTATALLEETISLVEKCKSYERELEKRDSIIQQAVFGVNSEVNKYVQTLLAGEVPRLVLKEFEASRQKNLKLDAQVYQLEKENTELKGQSFKLKEELGKLSYSHKLLMDEYSELNLKYNHTTKQAFKFERINDELKCRELSELRSLQAENYNLKISKDL
jgi:hypothetical protein